MALEPAEEKVTEEFDIIHLVDFVDGVDMQAQVLSVNSY